MATQDWLEKDFYKVLGVSKDADEATIKKAYRKLARNNHPDKNPGDKKAEERFKAVGEAYKVLSDPKQRQEYDQIRTLGASGFGGFKGGGFNGFAGAGGSSNPFFQTGQFGQNGGQAHFSGNFGGLEDLLSGLFGGGSGTGFAGGSPQNAGYTTAKPAKGADLATSAKLTFRQAAEGATVRLTVEGQTYTVRIPAGVSDGKKLRLAGKGRPGKNGGPAGDLVVSITVEPHPVYSITPQGLQMKLPISLPEAVRGAQIQVPMLSGEKITVKIPAGSVSGKRLRVRQQGLEVKGKRGDLLIELEVQTPPEHSPAALEALDTYASAIADWDPRAGLSGTLD
ncbi:DnaJ domain-containing protein [Gleimia sp. 6138-11-ORH1]|uniref:DnaJ C-terminal domain-containing protein n=1 Tax=Gleimia sp. 6138-11-ORH1 TaxID=2973937 RepID=UPI0021673985|nr:DnaJ C-terminal domain-containing protein [Gleimia sp. 6138-11-ORH1]MCS4484825.1 DnaJ domain-containing protein [Gleimia sp. 6138-11-ORH1]